MRLFVVIATLMALCLLMGVATAAPPSTGPEYSYIVNQNSNTITILDTSSNAVVKTLSVGSSPRAVAINPSGTYLYVSCAGSQYVAVYSTLDWSLVDTLSTYPMYPDQLLISPDGESLYLSAYSGSLNKLYTISTASMTVDTGLTQTLALANTTDRMTITPEGDHVVITDSTDKRIYVYHVSTNTVTMYNFTPTYASASPVDVSYVNGTEFGMNPTFLVASSGDSRVYIYNAFTNTIAGYYSMYGQASLVIADGTNSTMYVTFENNNNVTLMTNAGVVVWNTTLTARPIAMHQNSNGSVYAAKNNNQMDVILNGVDLGYVSVGSNPTFITSSPAYGGVADGMYVSFTAKTLYETVPVPNINVSVYDTSSRLLYTSTTDSAGAVQFYLSGLARYSLLFNQSPNINTWYNVTPISTMYLVDIPFTQVVGLTSWSTIALDNEQQNQITYTLDANNFNTTTGAAWMNVTYNDPSAATTQITFTLYQNNSTGSPTQIDQEIIGAANGAANFSIANAAGNSYSIKINATQSSGAVYTYITGLSKTFPGAKVLGGLMPASWYFWLAFGILLIFFSIGTIAKKGLIGVIGTVWTYIAIQWGWYSIYLPDIVAYGIMALSFILSIVMFMIERERYT